MKILLLAFRQLAACDPFRMAGATAFFTIFALPPMLMIIVRTFGIFMDRRTVGQSMMGPLQEIFGESAVETILQTIRSFRALQYNYLVTTAIFIFLLFVATTLFRTVRNSINEIWSIRYLQKAKLLHVLKSRAYATLVILAAGLLFLFVQLLLAWQHLLGKYFDPAANLGAGLQQLIVTIVTATWFFLLFLLLPDARPNRRIAAWGALITAVLFQCGKALLGVMLQPVKMTSFYGVSGAILLLLLFMFYSAFFLYFGAALIRAWGETVGKPLQPRPHAEFYVVRSSGMSKADADRTE